MAGRIVLFGATGFTGELTAKEMVARGLRPVLAGRDGGALRTLARELGGLEIAVADAERPSTVRALVERGDVLVTAVGPFGRWGAPAVEAAISAGAHYVDCCSEPDFIRGVFERYGPRASAAGCALVPAFGYEWVPGCLAGALGLRVGGDAAASVDIGYFAPGISATAISPGTRATIIRLAAEPGYAWRGGRLATVAGWSRRRTFELPSGSADALSVGSTEHLVLPRLAPRLRDVNVYVGWLGWASRPAQSMMLAASFALGMPGIREGLRGYAAGVEAISANGPDAERRARTRSLVVAEIKAADGALLSTVRLEGIEPYGLSARLLAWCAEEIVAGRVEGTGALGPVDALGLEALATGVAAAGLRCI